MNKETGKKKKRLYYVMGKPETSEEVNGITVYKGGEIYVGRLKINQLPVKVSCISCRHHQRWAVGKEEGSKCMAITMDDGFRYGIDDPKQTRCGLFRPHKWMSKLWLKGTFDRRYLLEK